MLMRQLAMDLTNPTSKTPFTKIESSPPQTTHHHPTKSLILTPIGHHQHPPEVMVSYKECLKNHAATLGGHALDGCGEFMPSPTSTPVEPTSLKCAACGCHRNFHRRDGPYDPTTTTITAAPFLHHNRHLPAPHQSSSPSPGPHSSPSPSPSPPQSVSSPIPYSYYSSAPQMLLALCTGGLHGPSDHENHGHQYNHCNSALNPTVVMKRENPNGRRRSRTKFSSEQKMKMRDFADKLGWKIHKCDKKLLQDFCSEVGVARGVLKVWMHNNKYNLGKREMSPLTLNNNNNSDNGNGRLSFDNNGYNINSNNNDGSNVHLHVSNNGSSSS